MHVEGTTVVIGGGSQGAGFGAAKALVRRGARNVILLARRTEILSEAANKLRTLSKGTNVDFFSVDLSNSLEVERTSLLIRNKYGVPDIIIYSAANGRFLSIEEETAEHVASSIGSTYIGAFNLTKSFIKDMLERNSGAICIVGSPARFMDFWAISYVASRRALHGFAAALQEDLWDTEIQVNYVEPTKITDSQFFDNNEGVLKRMPLIYRDDHFNFLHQNMDSVGDMIIHAIEKDSKVSRHWILTVSELILPFTRPLFSWIIRNTYLDYQKGGPISGQRAKVYNSMRTKKRKTNSFSLLLIGVLLGLFLGFLFSACQQ